MKKIVRSYSFAPETVQAVKKVAKMWKCSESHAADAMLSAYAAGEIKKAKTREERKNG